MKGSARTPQALACVFEHNSVDCEKCNVRRCTKDCPQRFLPCSHRDSGRIDSTPSHSCVPHSLSTTAYAPPRLQFCFTLGASRPVISPSHFFPVLCLVSAHGLRTSITAAPNLISLPSRTGRFATHLFSPGQLPVQHGICRHIQ